MGEAVTAPSGEQRTCKSCGASFAAEVNVCPSCSAPYEAPSAPQEEADPATVANVAPPKVPEPKPSGKPADLAAGETLLGQWKLESKIGEGGMGNVFLATELKLGRKVAVKALSTNNLEDETVKRFEREAQVMGKLDHPNIVTLYAVGRHREVPFLVMRYLEGGSLWDLLDANGGRLTPEQLLPLVKQLCSALGYIHGKNLIHRDLKPSNIFISPQGKVTLLDLGLARGHTTALTRTGIIWGTPDFMAPEQIVGEKQLDGRADLYALGVVLYRMISNTPPFPDADEQDLMRAHLTRPRPDIAKVWFQATPALSLMLQKAMAIKPEDRFQTSEEMSQAFERVVSTREPSTRASVTTAPALSPPAPPVSAPKPAAGPVPDAAMAAPPRASAGAAPTAAAPAAGPVPAEPAAASPRASAGAGVTTVPAGNAVPPSPAVAATDPAAPAAPPPSAPPPPVPSAPVISAAKPQAPEEPEKHQMTVKHQVIDELDDDATEMGELPPELMHLINGGESTSLPPPVADPVPPPPVAKKPEPIPRKSVSKPPAAAAGPVPDKGLAAPPRASAGGATAYDRPPAKVPAPAPQPFDTHTDEEPATGPQPVISDLDDDADMKTVVGANVAEIIAAVSSTEAAVPANPPAPDTTPPLIEAEKEQEPTRAMPPPTAAAPRVSAPRTATGTQRPVQRRSNTQAPAQRKETTNVSKKSAPQPPPAEEAPPWMHPYVLVTGGLLLLALGFLIGVLLR